MKKFSYTYSFFNGNYSMESKIIEYGIILSHIYKAQQTELISRLLQSNLRVADTYGPYKICPLLRGVRYWEVI